jgi:hypothetical protein
MFAGAEIQAARDRGGEVIDLQVEEVALRRGGIGPTRCLVAVHPAEANAGAAPVIVMAASSSIHGKKRILLVAAAWVTGVGTTSVASAANPRLRAASASASVSTGEGRVAQAVLVDPVGLVRLHADPPGRGVSVPRTGASTQA